MQGKVRLEDHIFSRSIKNFMFTTVKRYQALYHGVTFEFVSIGNGSSMEDLLADGDIDVGAHERADVHEPVFT